MMLSEFFFKSCRLKIAVANKIYLQRLKDWLDKTGLFLLVLIVPFILNSDADALLIYYTASGIFCFDKKSW